MSSECLHEQNNPATIKFEGGTFFCKCNIKKMSAQLAEIEMHRDNQAEVIRKQNLEHMELLNKLAAQKLVIEKLQKELEEWKTGKK